MATIRSVSVENRAVVSYEMDGDPVDGQIVSGKAFNNGVASLTATSTPPVSMVYAAEITFAGSSSATDTQTIDLSDFADIEGVAKDGQGLRVQVLHVITDPDNIGDVTIAGGASDPYEMFGAGNEVDLPPGTDMQMKFTDELPTVSGDSATLATDIDLTGNGSDVVKVLIALG
jgi:hypothetical protein